jgi:CheY-like chemotaxis protein
LPDEDGYDLIQQVREFEDEETRNLPALALTAFAREEDSLRALSAGFQRHASKPIEPSVLTTLVAALAGRSPETAALPAPAPAAALSALLSEL